jgi:hypothetical protein
MIHMPLQPEEVKEFVRMFDENIRNISAFAAARGLRFTEQNEHDLSDFIVIIIKAHRDLSIKNS